jgi:hypothetical protein
LGDQACKQGSREVEIKHLLGFSLEGVKAVVQRMMIARRDKDNLERHYHIKVCGKSMEEMDGSSSGRYWVTERQGMLKSATKHVLVMH